MVKLPSKRDIRAGTGPQVSAASINIARPQVNPNAAKAATLDLPIMGEEVIPKEPKPDFSGERRRIAALRDEQGRYEVEAARQKGKDLVAFGKEMQILQAQVKAEKDKQDTMDMLQGKSAYAIGMAQLKYEASKRPTNERAEYIRQGSKKLVDGLEGNFNDAANAARFRLEADVKNEQEYLDELTESDKALREERRVDIKNDLDKLRATLIDLGTSDPQRQQEIFQQIQTLIKSTDDDGIALFSPEESYDLAAHYIRGLAKEFVVAVGRQDPGEATRILNSKSRTKVHLGKRESDNRYWKMEDSGLGYAGKYQFGSPRLRDLGFYEFAEGEGYSDQKGWYGPKWKGKWNLPASFKGEDGKPIDSLEDFLGNPEAQEFVMETHLNAIDDYIEEQGYDKKIGSVINGAVVTRTGMHGAFHIGGSGGLNKVMNWSDSKPDINGTSSFTYFKEGSEYDWISAAMDPADRVELEQKMTGAYLLNELLVNILDDNAGPDQVALARETWLTDFGDIEKVNGALEDQRERNLSREAMALMQAGKPLNRNIKEHTDMNDALQRQVIPNLDDPESNSEQALKEIFARNNIISDEVKGQLEGMVESQDAKRVVRGLKIMRDLQQQNAAAFETDMGEQNAKKALLYSKLAKLYDDEDIFARMQAFNNPEEAERREKVRKEVITKDLKDVTAQQVADKFTRGFFVGDPYKPQNSDIAESLLQDYKFLYAEARAAGNSDDIAEAYALEHMKSKWGRSSIGGLDEIVELPPSQQAAYQVPGSDGTWIQKQAAKDLRGVIPQGARFVLRPDAQSYVEKKTKQPVGYRVFYQTDDGAWLPVEGKRLVFDPRPEVIRVGKELDAAEKDEKRRLARKRKLRDLDYDSLGLDSAEARRLLEESKTGTGTVEALSVLSGTAAEGVKQFGEAALEGVKGASKAVGKTIFGGGGITMGEGDEE